VSEGVARSDEASEWEAASSSQESGGKADFVLLAVGETERFSKEDSSPRTRMSTLG